MGPVMPLAMAKFQWKWGYPIGGVAAGDAAELGASKLPAAAVVFPLPVLSFSAASAASAARVLAFLLGCWFCSPSAWSVLLGHRVARVEGQNERRRRPLACIPVRASLYARDDVLAHTCVHVGNL